MRKVSLFLLTLAVSLSALNQAHGQVRERLSLESSSWTLHSVDDGDNETENYFVNRLWLHLHPHLQLSLNTIIGNAHLENLYQPDDQLQARVKLSSNQVFALGGGVRMTVIEEGRFKLRAFFEYNRTVNEFYFDIDGVEIQATDLQLDDKFLRDINDFARQHFTFRQSWARALGGLTFVWTIEKMTVDLTMGVENYLGRACATADPEGQTTTMLLSPKFVIAKCKDIYHNAATVEPGITYRPHRRFEVFGKLLYIPSSDLILGGSLGLTIFGF